jgi:hypothetical protein
VVQRAYRPRATSETSGESRSSVPRSSFVRAISRAIFREMANRRPAGQRGRHQTMAIGSRTNRCEACASTGAEHAAPEREPWPTRLRRGTHAGSPPHGSQRLPR